MADKNAKAVGNYETSALAETRNALAAAEGLLSRVAWCLGFGGPLHESRGQLEAWCSEHEANKRKGKSHG